MEQLVGQQQSSSGKAGEKAGSTPYLSPRAKARMVWLKIHRWMGLLTLIPMAILGVTGSAQVWPEETEALLNPGREVAATADPATVGEAHLAAAREALAPYGTIASLTIGEVGEPLVVTSTPHDDAPFGIGGPVSQRAFVDPDSAEVVDTAPTSGTFMWYMHFIHGLFLIPGWGRQAVGFMGFLLTVSAVTGLWVFWPGTKRFIAGLKWNRHEGKAINIHRQSGVILSIVIVVEAITGAWISFPAFFASIVEPGVEQPQRPRRGSGPAGEVLAMEDGQWIIAIGQARQAYNGRLTSINAPTSETVAWSATVSGERMNGSVTIPTGAGEVTVEESEARRGPPPPSTRAGAIASTMRQLHYALIGGIVWEVLVFLSGLALTFLALSGVYVWGKRKIRRRA